MLPPVHHAHHDGPGIGRDLYQVQTGLFGVTPCFFEGNDADLFAAGADQAYGGETDLLVDANPIVDSTPP
jgi:hypothetical protein